MFLAESLGHSIGISKLIRSSMFALVIFDLWDLVKMYPILRIGSVKELTLWRRLLQWALLRLLRFQARPKINTQLILLLLDLISPFMYVTSGRTQRVLWPVGLRRHQFRILDLLVNRSYDSGFVGSKVLINLLLDLVKASPVLLEFFSEFRLQALRLLRLSRCTLVSLLLLRPFKHIILFDYVSA